MDATSATNTTALIPSARDLLLVVPRLAQRAGTLFHIPEGIMDGIWSGGSVIADPTSQQVETLKATLTNTSALAQSTAASLEDALREGWAQGSAEESSSVFGMMLQFVGKLKNFGGIFSYLTSRWALATFAVAIALNRLQFYASPRERLQLRWYVRLAIYAVPIVAFLSQMELLLEAMRCQTSPDFALLRYGDPLKTLSMDFGGEEGFLYSLSSTLLFWKDDAECCAARKMSIPALEGDTLQLHGTMSLLFKFFLTLCMSQLFETLFCALSGRHPVPETGMTIFEHSLAFAECEAMISSALGLGYFGHTKSESSSSTPSTNASPVLTRVAILQRLNVPPEVLLVCLITCCSHLSSAFLCIIDKRHKVRLVNTAIWSCCYMAAFVWSIVRIISTPIENVSDLGVLRFPTVCIVGFIPHLLILVGIVLCGFIYGLALLLTAFSIPDEALATGLSFPQRLAWAYRSLQANVQFTQNSAIRIHMSQDFYTVLLKVGFNVLTAASEAVYLNEGSKVNVPKMTWVEQKRIDELAVQIDQRRANLIPPELLGEEIAKGVGFVDHQHNAIGTSPYARERRSRPKQGDVQSSMAGQTESGLGVVQRRSRMQLTFDFVAGIFWLLLSFQAQLALNALHSIGFDRRPAWLVKAAGTRANNNANQVSTSLQALNSNTDTLAFWMVNADGALVPAKDRSSIDVEAEMRRKRARMGLDDEPALSESVYSWWKQNGWFGDLDGSGDYAPPAPSNPDDDDDHTSELSFTTSASSAASDSGARTPTQRDPFSRRSASPTPSWTSTDDDAQLDPAQLSRLLAPTTPADRAEAALLASSLTSTRPLTRSRYRAQQTRSSTAILASLPDSEAELESFILSQRSKRKTENRKSAAWEQGGEGMGEGGPQCVVCQSGPRTVLVWPCGCLSMCDECRVGLAMRNFSKCVCCRGDTAAYSRLYVP